jgi:hypothetical protein
MRRRTRSPGHVQRLGVVMDALLFPAPVRAPDGRPALALLHRPGFQTAPPDTSAGLPAS